MRNEWVLLRAIRVWLRRESWLIGNNIVYDGYCLFIQLTIIIIIIINIIKRRLGMLKEFVTCASSSSPAE